MLQVVSPSFVHRSCNTLILLLLTAACSSQAAGPVSPTATPDARSIVVFPAQQPVATHPSDAQKRDDSRSISAIKLIVEQPGGDLSYLQEQVFVNSPEAKGHLVFVYEDQNGARYYVDEGQYVFVYLQPTGLRFASGPSLTDSKLLEAAQGLVSKSEGFDRLQAELRFEQAQKGENHFFTWSPSFSNGAASWIQLQIVLRGDGTLLGYTNTLIYKP
jgi:hypothetical protein